MRVKISQKVAEEIKKKKPFVLRAGDLIWEEVGVMVEGENMSLKDRIESLKKETRGGLITD